MRPFGLEKTVVDLDRIQIRRRATNEDLEINYDKLLDKVKSHADLFEDQDAFTTTIDVCASGSRPNFSARNPKYPGMFNMKHSLHELENIFNPDKKMDEKFFYVPHIMIATPYKEEPFSRLYDSDEHVGNKITPEMAVKLPLIELPNDRTPNETKASLFHEGLHYVMFVYQHNSNRLFTDNANGEFESKKQRRTAEGYCVENAVEYLTDVMLEDDKDALFEHRWGRGYTHIPVMFLSHLAGVSSAGAIIGWNITNPAMLPLAIVPLAVDKLIRNAYKNRMKKHILEPLPRPEQKI